MDNYIEEYQKKVHGNSRVLDKCERELSTMKVKNDNSKHYLTEVRAKNEKL